MALDTKAPEKNAAEELRVVVAVAAAAEESGSGTPLASVTEAETKLTELVVGRKKMRPEWETEAETKGLEEVRIAALAAGKAVELSWKGETVGKWRETKSEIGFG